MRTRARRLASGAPAGGGQPFPSLLVGAGSLSPRGAFAEAQAAFLEPDPALVARLAALLKEKRLGIVAHFYMDPEVQGVLTAARALWPHIHISDSLVMADSAAAMVSSGCQAIAVLGVDFMSENVRAILDDAGHSSVPVYRMSAQPIGCTLAAAAEEEGYYAWLDGAAGVANSLHVVYINTSLRTKAQAHARVPTITCTSSNVLATVLTAAAQQPDLAVWYGPDAYMGANLVTMLSQLATLPDDEVAAVHPAHTAASLAALLPRVRYYRHGACVVHELFAGDVVAAVEEHYGDAFLTAHFEVPGEMFALALRARATGRGVVGSTQNILDFVLQKARRRWRWWPLAAGGRCGAPTRRPSPTAPVLPPRQVDDALARPQAEERLRVVLGTETGMLTSIVDAVQRRLRAAPPGGPTVEVELIFPVSTDAITRLDGGGGGQPQSAGPLAGLTIVPGPASGEGCSSEGGCASCPYMKMNSLQALLRVAERVGSPGGAATLVAFEPRKYEEAAPGGGSIAAAGCVPILHMRDFQASKRLSETLLADVRTRSGPRASR